MGPGFDALVVMARFPRPGAVKSRLAAAIGDRAAADVYRAFLDDLPGRLAGDSRWRFLWAFEPADSAFAAEVGGGLPAIAQVAGDLGVRMAEAMAEAFRRGAGRVVLVGSDLPHLGAGRVAAAFSRLDEGADLVLGPAEDGGYYLIGSGSVPPVFEGVVWGEADVLARTRARALEARLRVALIEPTWDVDRPRDLMRLLRDPVRTELPATDRCLRRLFPDR